MRTGTIELELLSEGEIPIPGDSVFYPAKRAQWFGIIPDDGNGMISAPVGRTLEELVPRGVAAEDVRYVILTH